MVDQSDGDPKAKGLHAGFKLSNSGETVWLIDSDQNGNQILDELKFGQQQDGQSLGRSIDGDFKIQTPTPGKKNVQ